MAEIPEQDQGAADIVVEQVDREAAANYLFREGTGHHKRAIAGELDGGDLVQLLAAHRLTGRDEGMRRAAEIAASAREKFGSPTGSGYDNGLWDQSVRIETAILTETEQPK